MLPRDRGELTRRKTEAPYPGKLKDSKLTENRGSNIHRTHKHQQLQDAGRVPQHAPEAFAETIPL
jgi:hypothetical protein